jgi:hypothetical protein
MEQTFGQKRVRASFNASGDSTVDTLKAKTSELIDICEQMRGVNVEGPINGEKMRLLSLAQTAYEEAGMWAVKAATAQ